MSVTFADAGEMVSRPYLGGEPLSESPAMKTADCSKRRSAKLGRRKAHGAVNKSHLVCARRRDGEPAVS